MLCFLNGMGVEVVYAVMIPHTESEEMEFWTTNEKLWQNVRASNSFRYVTENAIHFIDVMQGVNHY